MIKSVWNVYQELIIQELIILTNGFITKTLLRPRFGKFAKLLEYTMDNRPPLNHYCKKCNRRWGHSLCTLLENFEKTPVGSMINQTCHNCGGPWEEGVYYCRDPFDEEVRQIRKKAGISN
jgi:hypothetical protein